MNRDTVIGIVGAVILVTAMVGVFYYERNVAAPPVGDGDDAPANATGPTATGTVALGETHSQVVNVTQTAARNVTFTLTWSAASGADTLQLTVAPPTGSGILEGNVSEPSDSGEIVVTVPVPEGASPAGGWKIEVTFSEARPDQLPGGVPPPVTPPNSTDASVDYTVAITLS